MGNIERNTGRPLSKPLSTLLLTMLVAVSAGPAAASVFEHSEFEATLAAPYQGEAAGGARSFTLVFDYPLVAAPQSVAWRLELSAPDGRIVRQWDGTQALVHGPVSVDVRWDGRLGAAPAPAGIYRVRMQAWSRDGAAAAGVSGAAAPDDVAVQQWDIAVGRIAAPAMPAFRALPSSGDASAAPAPGSLPYTVFLGNLHSQTSHSDGGGDLAGCNGAQDPQTGAYGPLDAYAFAQKRGLDILVTSEHNHMYDGSDGTNLDAKPAAASALFRSGLTAASAYNAFHPGFLAVYALEWGVIANGGHMNIFNSTELLGWEHNAAGQLLADTFTPKSDYAALYALMRQRGWVGQFNHPAQGGQFNVGGMPLGYSADGDQAMALCEVVNSNAFSTNTSETEARRSNFEFACNKALEAGYHVAFSTNQDNHCANWGASYTNRTGVLLPAGRPLSNANFIDALKARRVFATMDKGSQLVLTANGHLMGERFANRGPLALVAHFANAAGKAVSKVTVFEGVPGRNGSVSELSSSAQTTITPAPGEHFYYVRLTQEDGNMLWSAPVWVTQSSPQARPAKRNF
jgi:hypothetical protein